MNAQYAALIMANLAQNARADHNTRLSAAGSTIITQSRVGELEPPPSLIRLFIRDEA
jgi:hypothetical protein